MLPSFFLNSRFVMTEETALGTLRRYCQLPDLVFSTCFKVSLIVCLACAAMCTGRDAKSLKTLIYFQFLGETGSGGRDRTYDQLINSQLLYR